MTKQLIYLSHFIFFIFSRFKPSTFCNYAKCQTDYPFFNRDHKNTSPNTFHITKDTAIYYNHSIQIIYVAITATSYSNLPKFHFQANFPEQIFTKNGKFPNNQKPRYLPPHTITVLRILSKLSLMSWSFLIFEFYFVLKVSG